jgi:hypothetical protein
MYFYAFGKYDIRGDFFVHQTFICSNMKSRARLPKHNQIACCTNAKNVVSSVSRLVFSQQGQLLNEEAHWLWFHNTCITWCGTTKSSTIVVHRNNPGTTFDQEWENDEIMHILAAPGAYIQMPI